MGLSGPPPKVYFGNHSEMAKLGYLRSIEKWMSQYGPTFMCYLGINPIIITEDLKIIKSIMVENFGSFVNRPNMPQPARRRKERGLVFLRDEQWRRIRRTLTPTLSSKKLRMMTPLIQATCKRLRNKMAAVSNTDKSIDVWQWFGMFTIEVILVTAFGRDVDSGNGKGNSLTSVACKVFQSWGPGADKVWMHTSHFPWLLPIWGYYARRTELAQAWDYLEATALKIIEDRQNSMTVTGSAAQDLLQFLLEAHDEETTTKSNRYLTNDEIVVLVTTIMLASFDTTSNTLSFTAYLLAINPTVQDKLIQEINNYYENNPDSSLYDAAENIECVTMVLCESLRMFPPAPRLFRKCNQACAVSDDLTIEEGVDIVFPIYSLHHNPEHWPDPDKFDPERFNPNNEQSYPTFAYLPFGEGPRHCIGKRLALLETKMILVALLKDLHFKTNDETEIPVDLKVGLTMIPRNGIKLSVVSNSS